MDVTIKDKKLRISEEKGKLRKDYGVNAKTIQLRLDQLRAATSLEDVRYLPGKYHELLSDRKGQWACSIDKNYRLIFEPHETPVPTDKDGKYIWIEIKGVEVIEIADYH